MKTKRRLLINITLMILFFLGIIIILYPAVSDWFNGKQHNKLIINYNDEIETLPEDFIEQEWGKAVVYNQSLIGLPIKDPFLTGSGMALAGNYMQILDFDGIMGYVDIPVINVHLPIYHGTSEEVLRKGVGHLENSAFPIGGEGSHPILSAHTGIPSAKLFSDLKEMKIGDMFSVRVLSRTMSYKVDDIQVILPDETKNLLAMEGKDWVTLITCTPYGINSHRLVVRGERCYELSESLFVSKENKLLWEASLIVFVILAFFFLIATLVKTVRTAKAKRKRYAVSL